MEITQDDLERVRRQQVRINVNGEEAKELAKWEQFPTYYAGLGAPNKVGNPYVYRPYPKMLYKAFENPARGMKLMCIEPPPHPSEFRTALDPSEAYRYACEAAEQFSKKCMMIVQDEREYQRARESGWCESPQDAVEWAQNRYRKLGDAAAERNWQDRNMSENAKAEVAKAEAENGPVHLDAIPEAPIKKRRGRPPKARPVEQAG